jgi:glutathione S-transferase
MILYDSKLSGNGWKVRILLGNLGRTYERRILNLAAGEAKTPEFLALNPWARVPVLQLDNGVVLRESNAILMHLARDTALFPVSREREILEWLYFEQYDHLRFFARPRFIVSIAKTAQAGDAEVEYLRETGSKALERLELQLAGAAFLAGDYSIADIALFPYTAMAEMGGYDLTKYPHVSGWLERIRAQAGFVTLAGNPEHSPNLPETP